MRESIKLLEKTNFSQQRKLVLSQMNHSMRNHPPLKSEIITILDQVKKDFPELKALKESMTQLPNRISVTQFNLIPIFDLLSTIEKEINKKPFHSKRGKNVFARLLWLVYKLYFNQNFFDILEKDVNNIELIDIDPRRLNDIYRKSKNEINAERIIVNIQLINSLMKEITTQTNIQVFREDVPQFYSKISTKCIDSNDFSVRVQAIASIFEVDIKPIRKLFPQEDYTNLKSIRLIERWLELKKIVNHPFITTWKNIIKLRNNPPTHASIRTDMLPILAHFDVNVPLNYSIFWDSITIRFLESLDNFLGILNSLR